MRKLLPLAALPLLAAGCTGPTQEPPAAAAGQAAAGGSAFTQALAQEYQSFSRSEYQQLDWPDQGAFKDKARMAASGQVPPPEDPRNRGVGTGFQWHPDVDIGKQQRAEAIQGRDRLLAVTQGEAAQRNPQSAARAQVAYDCWVEQLEEGWQADDIERCRKAFYTALQQAEARPVQRAAAPAPEPERYQIYFEFDSAQLTPTGQRIVAAAAEDIRRENAATVEVQGHADRAGTDDYNRELSAARAEAVKDVLVSQGIPADAIRTQARGEAEPVVTTPDGIAQPQNRRAVIDFD